MGSFVPRFAFYLSALVRGTESCATDMLPRNHSSAEKPIRFSQANFHRFISELKEFIRIPSVSAQPKHVEDLKKCARWLANQLQRAGLDRVKIVPTQGSPVVYAEWLRAPPRPTVLIYGHYDVVPPEPLSEWKSPPFQPVIRGKDLFGRGACDDKGQLFCHVKALEALLQTQRELPVNVKCLFEGEEEINSPNLAGFVERNQHALSADVAVMSDTRFLAPGRPAIAYALRGKLIAELEVRGPGHELHCGNFGGAIHNPLQALCGILATLHDRQARVAIPGFYNRVRRWSQTEREYMARTGPSDGEILTDASAQKVWGEPGYSEYERTTIRPALSTNGIVGGYQGVGAKAVIPATAVAKLDFRLVPDQEPREIERLLRQHVARVAPPTVRSAVRILATAPAALVDRRHPALRAAAFAYRKGFGVSPVLLRSGGTIPVTHTFQRVLGVPTVLMGFALPEDRIHAPNEKFHLPNFFRGIQTCVWFLRAVAAEPKRTAFQGAQLELP
jgi:acetylornithine deacetylase/succinyl-diaminopimelate desuccinylase-like protein